MPVYPEMENFGSLDIRNLKQSLKETVDNFSKSLSSNIYSGPETFFDEKYRFNYIFFKNDFISQWKKYFNQDFPYTEKNDKEIVAIRQTQSTSQYSLRRASTNEISLMSLDDEVESDISVVNDEQFAYDEETLALMEKLDNDPNWTRIIFKN